MGSAELCACTEALEQIEDRRYAEEFLDYGYSKVYAYGIAFYKKRCRIAVKDISLGESHCNDSSFLLMFRGEK